MSYQPSSVSSQDNQVENLGWLLEYTLTPEAGQERSCHRLPNDSPWPDARHVVLSPHRQKAAVPG